MRACPPPVPVPSIETVLPIYEQIAGVNFPTKVIAISLNTVELSPGEAESMVGEHEDKFGIPTTDPYRFGVAKIVEALEQFR